MSVARQTGTHATWISTVLNSYMRPFRFGLGLNTHPLPRQPGLTVHGAKTKPSFPIWTGQGQFS